MKTNTIEKKRIAQNLRKQQKQRKKKNKHHFHYVRIVIQFLATWIIPRNRLERLNRANMVFWCTNLAYFAVLDLSFNKCMAYANKEAEYNP
jgi:hypothetical protein